MDRFNAPRLFNGIARHAALAMICSAVAACGDASCPGGSISINGRCEAELSCGPGEVEVDGTCMDSSAVRGDGGPDAEVTDGSSVDPDSGTDAAADPDGEVVTPPDTICTSVIDCGDHGVCEAVRGAPRCACDDGFAGAQCETCVSGLVLEDDECVPVCDANSAPDCGENGACDEEDGVAVCDCEHPAAGDYCTECAEGFALQDDGSCEPDCGDCGAHGFCDEDVMTPTCDCFDGYAITASGCVWTGDGETGGIVDGDLDDDSAWTVDNATLNAGELSFLNPNVGGVCQLGSIEQTLHMPSREQAEPLVLEIEARTTCTSTDPEACPALLVDIGDTVTRVTMAGGPAARTDTLEVCLGDAVYQDEVVLRVRPGVAYNRGISGMTCGTAWPTLNRLGIRPATTGECPDRGELLAGLGSTAGWTLSGATLSGGKLTVTAANAEADTLVSVPAEGGMAVRLGSTTQAGVTMLLDGILFHLGADAETTSVCMPKWTFGSVHHLGFRRMSAGFDVTSLQLVADPACAGGELDSSFERALGTGGFSRYLYPATNPSYANAHDGMRAWRVQGTTSMGAAVLLPGYGDPDAVPAIGLWSRMEATRMQGTFSIASGVGRGATITVASTSWALDVVCLDQHWVGQPAFMQAQASAALLSGGTGTATLWIDQLGPDSVSEGLCD